MQSVTCIAEMYDRGYTAESVRIQYGGSVNAGNAAELFAQPDIDGGISWWRFTQG